jgi:hypothetical protein
MAIPITTATWNTPKTFGSLEMLTSTEYNNLAKDVGFLYARPWIFGWMRNGQSQAVAAGATGVLFNNTTDFAYRQNTAGPTIGWAAGGAFNIPSQCPGMYEVEIKVMTDSGNQHYQILLELMSGTTSLSAYTGTWETQRAASTGNGSSILKVSVPMGVGAPLGEPTWMRVKMRAYGGTVNALGTPTSIFTEGPATTPAPYYNTYVSIRYTGASNGGY